MHFTSLLTFCLVQLYFILAQASDAPPERSRHEIEKEMIRKEAEYQKQLDRESYPDLSREERRDRDKEIDKAAKELF